MPKSAIPTRCSGKIEEAIIRLLTKRRQTLALAESCTGGCIAHRLTNVPGASAVFLGGWWLTATRPSGNFSACAQKHSRAHGAVSEAVARAMAEGAREKFGADFAIAVTGIAGPTGGTKDKPVGTVFIALAGASETMVERKINPLGANSSRK